MFPMPLTFRTSTDSLQLALRLDRLSLCTTAQSQSILHFRRPINLSFSRGDSLKGIHSVITTVSNYQFNKIHLVKGASLGNMLLCNFLLNQSVRAEKNEAETVNDVQAVDALSSVKHVLLPVTNRNPYLSEGTRQVLFLSLCSMPNNMKLVHAIYMSHC